MERVYKNLIYLIAAILLVVVFLLLFYQNFFSAKSINGIKITKIKNHYTASENIILSGISRDNCDILVFINDKVGITKSDKNGRWSVNLGKISEGRYALEVLSDDSSDSRSVATAQIIVNKFFNFMAASITGQHGLWGAPQEKLIMVPISTPPVLSGNWKLMK